MSALRPALSCLGITVAANEHGRIGAWSPGIGDPTAVGWITVAAYLLAAWACARAARNVARDVSKHRELETVTDNWWRPIREALLGRRAKLRQLSAQARLRSLWISVAIVMLGLGINKQLDLQTALAESGRWLSRRQGWYEERRLVQVVFIAFVVGLGLWALRALFALARGQTRTVAGVLVGSIFLCCFVAIRASSFHHVDHLLGLAPAGVRVNAALELSGIACVFVGACWAPRQQRFARGTAEEGAEV